MVYTLGSPRSAQGVASSGTPVLLDVPSLLAASSPRRGMGRLFLLLPLLVFVGLVGTMALLLASPGGAWLPAGALSMLVLAAGSMAILARAARLARAERQSVAEIDELVALRHFGFAAARLQALLCRPMRMRPTRLLSLVQLARVLMRYERFEDSVEVADAILGDPFADPAIRFAVGCGRAMSLLRAGLLYDACEAIGQLRREVSRLDDAVRRLSQSMSDDSGGAEQARPESLDSVALTLVELYRDIQTRHNDDALATLEVKGLRLRDGLGVRLADALALGSVAAHRVGAAERACQLWVDATCLIPEIELRRRYPEVAEVAGVYAATLRPEQCLSVERP